MIMKTQHGKICGIQLELWLEGNYDLKCFIRKEGKLKINNSSLHLKNLEEEQEI